MPKPLEVTLPSDREVRVTRTFNAPRTLVWDAHTKPELIQKWMLGPPGWSMPVCEMDVRKNGKYRWRWRNDSSGKEFGFHGTFEDVKAPSRIAHDQYFDPGDVGGSMPANESGADHPGAQRVRRCNDAGQHHALCLEGSPRRRRRDRHD